MRTITYKTHRQQRLPLFIRLLLALFIAGPALAHSSISYAATCSTGAYWDGTTCIPAPPGSYVPLLRVTATSAILCPVGAYQDLAGQNSCKLASPGFFVVTTGAMMATPCAPGAYQEQAGQSSCLPAPAGSFAVGTRGAGATAASPCTPGTYQEQAGQSSCMSAPAGSFAAGSAGGAGAKTATACDLGTYQDETGKSSCKLAPLGYYVDSKNSIAPRLCQEGMYQDETGKSSCKTPAENGKASADKTTVICDVGYAESKDLTGELICVLAP